MHDTVVFFVTTYPVFLGIATVAFLVSFREANQGQYPRIYITDYWTAIVGLTPTFWLARAAFGEDRMNLPGNDIEPWVFVYSVGLGQLAGMLMTRASFHARETTCRGVWFQIVQILFGAMVGLLMPVVGVVVITIVVMIFLILANLWPVILLVWIYSIATRRRT